MDRQRSSSLKPTRILFLPLTLSCSLLLCIFSCFFILSSYPSLLHENASIQLGSLLETAAADGLFRISAAHHGGFALQEDGRGEKNDFGSKARVYKHVDLSGDGSGSFLGAKDVDLESTHFEKGPDSNRKGGGFGKGESFASLGEDSRAPLFEQGNSCGGATLGSNLSVVMRAERGEMESCDIYQGRWVFDQSYPLYSDRTCPFVDEGFSCQSNGRPDRDYVKWRWQPSTCDLPRFDAVKMLERIRGKRLVFAGDSISRNQWESLLCMLMPGVSDPKRVYEAHGRKITRDKGVYSFKFADYKCSIEYYVTHFLVREGKSRVGKRHLQTLRIDTIDRSSSKWRGADILVFNTAHWWSHHKTKAGRNYFQEGDMVHPKLDVTRAFRKALLTWATWIDQNIDPSKTTVFFRSSSPSHYSGGEWNSGGHCGENTHPLNDMEVQHSPMLNVILNEVLSQMKTPVTVLNVTALSGLRIDAHPSVYGKKSSGIQDCSHWCLPGLPDVWNEFLYYNMLSDQMSHEQNQPLIVKKTII